MKLQKLVYFAHGWWLQAHPEPILDEAPQVWKHGPVFDSLYRVLAGFGPERVTSPQRARFGSPPPRVDDNDVEAHELIEFVWGRYGWKRAFTLSELTHKIGTPWQIMAERYNYRVPLHLEIDQELIQQEFTRLAREDAAA